VDTAFMGLTSCRRITIAKTLAHRRRECAIGIMPTAVSLSNAPSTAIPSSVMGPKTVAVGCHQLPQKCHGKEGVAGSIPAGAPPARETGVSEDCWGRRLVIEASFESRSLGDGRLRRPLLGLAPALLLVRGSIPYRGGEGNTVRTTALQARGYGSTLGAGAESVSDGRAPPRPRATSSSRRPGVRA
jgi:hypothetical protein